jgi:hypothetical protein
MAWQGKKLFHQRLESRDTYQPSYHADHICGSSFHGLAYTVQEQLQRRDVNSAMSQVKSCIEQRQQQMRNRQFPDPEHNGAIQILIAFYQKLQIININFYNYANYLHLALVRYNDSNHEFKITVNNMTVGGKNKIKRRQTKNKKTKLRFRYKKNKTLKKKKLKSK